MAFLTRLVLLTDTRQAMVSWRYRFMGSGAVYVDRRVIEEEAMMDEAFEDAQRIAEGYWNE
jgi:hypothetical protein